MDRAQAEPVQSGADPTLLPAFATLAIYNSIMCLELAI